MSSRVFSTARAFLAALLFAVAVVACGDAGTRSNETLWVKDAYVQCNQFDEPFRECLLVSHAENELYRHIEGTIEGFDFEPGTAYELEVIRTDNPAGSGDPTYRLVKILSTE